MYKVVKTFPHSLGLSVAFRQWRAESHCRFLHGYALEVDIGVSSEKLDIRGWCFDFGSFKRIGTLLRETFDHKLLIAADDPCRAELENLRDIGMAQLLIMDCVGCEAFAKFIFDCVRGIVEQSTDGRVHLDFVTVREHEANSATYAAEQ